MPGQFSRVTFTAVMVVLSASIGCHLPYKSKVLLDDGLDHCLDVATAIEYPAAHHCDYVDGMDPLDTPAPRQLDRREPTEYWDLTLEDAVSTALRNSDVLTDLGGRVLTNPESVPTVYDPAIAESDPLFGPEGALSAFDAQLSTNLFWQKNDRVFNNRIEGGGINQFQQDLAGMDTELSKVAATGTRFSVRNLTQYDANNTPFEQKIFPNSWDGWFEATVRQPLLQGAGVTFNRIAGPNAQPGFNFSTGVVIARVNTDISLADFEAGVIRFVSDVEDAYWELYFAYRELDAAALARDSALETWRVVHAKFTRNLRGGEAFKEARSRAQYYQFQDQVQDALSGVPAQSRSVGVYRGERRLRTLMALPTSDERLIRPADEPPSARYAFGWGDVLSEALVRRVELRRQMWQILRRELELTAARNFTLPRLDAFATYRLRGFGDNMTGDDTVPGIDPRFSSAYKNLGTWDHQEWEGGLQLNIPLGFRQGWAGVRQAELQLARERAIYEEQERQVALGLSDAVSETSRAYAAVQVGYNRLVAAEQDQDATNAAYDADQATVELILESQQRLADAGSRYYRNLTDYAEALKNVHREKGSLLEYNGVFLGEGPWPAKAYRDARELSHRLRAKPGRFHAIKPAVISRGPLSQQYLTPMSMMEVEKLEPPPRPRDAEEDQEPQSLELDRNDRPERLPASQDSTD